MTEKKYTVEQFLNLAQTALQLVEDSLKKNQPEGADLKKIEMAKKATENVKTLNKKYLQAAIEYQITLDELMKAPVSQWRNFASLLDEPNQGKR